MCMGHGGPPFGVPIDAETHELYTPELKDAWTKFDAWWKQAQNEAEEKGEPVRRSDMPADIAAAFKLINETLIPGYDNAYGSDSCYMQGVAMQMID